VPVVEAIDGTGSNAGAIEEGVHRSMFVLRGHQCRQQKVKAVGQFVAPDKQDP